MIGSVKPRRMQMTQPVCAQRDFGCKQGCGSVIEALLDEIDRGPFQRSVQALSMTPENIERAARIFDAGRRDNCFVDEIPAELGLDNLEDAARVAERVVALSGERVGVESRTGAPTLGSGGNVRRFRFGPQSGSHSHVSSSRSSNRPCGFPATGSRTRSCLRPRKAGRSRGKVNEVVVLP